MTDDWKAYADALQELADWLDQYIAQHRRTLDDLRRAVGKLRREFGLPTIMRCADCPTDSKRPAEVICAACQTPVCWWHSHDNELCLKCYGDDLTGLVREVDHDGQAESKS